jgi:hypothetical protein
MPKRKKAVKARKKPLDMVFGGRPRGRPGVRPSEVRGRGDHYRLLFTQIWKQAGEALLKARTEEDVSRAFDASPSYKMEFVPIASLVLRILRDPRFPKRPEPQRNFMADSLAGRGLISPRRSRDICERERKTKVNYIIRQDYYIECTCRYQGPANYGKCPKCGTDRLFLALPPVRR